MLFHLKSQNLSTTLSEDLLYYFLSLEVTIGMVFQNVAPKSMEIQDSVALGPWEGLST